MLILSIVLFIIQRCRLNPIGRGGCLMPGSRGPVSRFPDRAALRDQGLNSEGHGGVWAPIV